jgi:hypothetical protein
MKLLVYSFILGLIVTVLISVLSFGQVTPAQSAAASGPLQTGWAVITPVTGTGDGLSVSEVFGQQIGGNLFQASVLNSPPVTLTDVVLNVNLANGTNTGIAIVNPNASTATVALNARNQLGAEVATRTITIGAHGQISDFATQLFPGDPNFIQGITGLLFISSDIPIGVLGLTFSGGTFASLPVASQLSTTNSVIATSSVPQTITVPVTTTITTPVVTTSNGVTITSVTPATAFSPVTPSFNGVPTPPTLLPPPTANTPPTTAVPITGIPTSIVTSTGTVPAFAATTTTSAAILVFPQVTAGVGGTGSSLLPQVATGGGWVTQITIANTSPVSQAVRVDFFNPFGAPLATSAGSSIPSMVIAPGGVVSFSF